MVMWTGAASVPWPSAGLDAKAILFDDGGWEQHAIFAMDMLSGVREGYVLRYPLTINFLFFITFLLRKEKKGIFLSFESNNDLSIKPFSL